MSDAPNWPNNRRYACPFPWSPIAMHTMELSADERRMIELQRARASIESRPVDKDRVVLGLRIAIQSLSHTGNDIDPNNTLWSKLIRLSGGTPKCSSED